jgi:hypothetical protein
MSALYTALAILGWVSFCALIAWFVGRVLDYAGKIFDDRNREFANADCAWGEIVRLPDELRTGQRIGSGLGDAAYRAAAGPSRTTLTHAFTRPSSGTEAL